MKEELAHELRQLVDKTQRAFRALQNIGRPVDTWDDWLVVITIERLDIMSSTLLAAENPPDNQNQPPTFADLLCFLESRVRTLKMSNTGRVLSKYSNQPARGASSSNSRANGTSTFRPAATSFHAGIKPERSRSSRRCSLCSAEHYVGSFPIFLDKSSVDRRGHVRRLGLCFNCRGCHRVKDCGSQRRCAVCEGNHNTLLHPNNSEIKAKNSQPTDQPSGGGSRVGQTTLTATSEMGHFRTFALFELRALLDQGSQVSFVSEIIAVMLNLPRRAVQIPLTGLGSTSAGTARSATHVTLQSIYESDFKLEFQALILPRLTPLLPGTRLIELDIPAMSKLPLADPQFYEPERVDLLLGVKVYGKLLRPGLRHFPPRNLIAQNTYLGWILSGSIKQSPPGQAESLSSLRRVEFSSINLVALQCRTEENLSKTLQRFWELEEVPHNPSKLSPDEERCEQIFANTHSRTAALAAVISCASPCALNHQ